MNSRGEVLCLRIFFRLAQRAPNLLVRARSILCELAFRMSATIRKGTRANAARLLGPDSTAEERDQLAKKTLESFYLFCCDIGRNIEASREKLLSQIENFQGHDQYPRHRPSGQGVIIVTAHMGSFEIGMAGLREIEPHIHVVFRRDAVGEFEKIRSALRKRLDIQEAALDDGFGVWIRLRDALLAGEAVVLQGDRVMPGHKGHRIPFFDGHIDLPPGPYKLALATGAPVIPVFSIRDPSGKIRLFVENPIFPQVDGVSESVHQFARVLEKFLRKWPEQWLILHPAWSEDQIQR
jgi:lauroyl/myristoyl acyltransferase